MPAKKVKAAEPTAPALCAQGHSYNIQPHNSELAPNEYVVICLTCGDCRTVRP